MNMIQFAIFFTVLLCSLVAGLVFTFAIIAMPGIRRLGDLAFLKAFKEMDRVIQNNQPIFVLVWLGSVVAMLCSTVLGIWQLEGLDRTLLLAACVIYLFGVQLPTAAINIPLNNHLQALDLEAITEPELLKTAASFKSRWIRWNSVRTVLATLTTALLLVLLMRL